MLVAAVLALGGCPNPSGGDPDGGRGGGTGGEAGGAGGGGGIVGSGGGTSFASSAKAIVRFKRSERLNADFAKSLGLPPAAVCNELGLYSCAAVHGLSLGGVDAYNIGLYEPVPFTGLTSPLAVDRLALAACVQRVTSDLMTPATALVFKAVSLDPNGKLNNVNAAEVTTAIDRLYKQVVLRPATDAEVVHLKQLYADIVATNKPEPGKMWMTLSCFAVLTSVESVFY